MGLSGVEFCEAGGNFGSLIRFSWLVLTLLIFIRFCAPRQTAGVITAEAPSPRPWPQVLSSVGWCAPHTPAPQLGDTEDKCYGLHTGHAGTKNELSTIQILTLQGARQHPPKKKLFSRRGAIWGGRFPRTSPGSNSFKRRPRGCSLGPPQPLWPK